MDTARAEEARKAVDAVYRNESRRVFATLVRLLGDFDIAEEAMHEAFRAALEQWPVEGVPANPRAWLVSTGRSRRSTASAATRDSPRSRTSNRSPKRFRRRRRPSG